MILIPSRSEIAGGEGLLVDVSIVRKEKSQIAPLPTLCPWQHARCTGIWRARAAVKVPPQPPTALCARSTCRPVSNTYSWSQTHCCHLTCDTDWKCRRLACSLRLHTPRWGQARLWGEGSFHPCIRLRRRKENKFHTVYGPAEKIVFKMFICILVQFFSWLSKLHLLYKLWIK